MHELGIAVEIAERAWARADGARIERVVVEIGALTAVLPDALRFAWELLSAPGAEHGLDEIAGAELMIVETSGDELRIRELEVRDVHDLRM